MSWTKRQLVDAAHEELGLASYTFDITPEEQQAAVRRLDALMATWGIIGIRIGYNATLDPLDADPDQASGVPDWANEAIFLALARRVAPSFGKIVSQETKTNGKFAYDAMLSRITATPPSMQYVSNLPSGAGNRRTSIYQPFVVPPADRLTAGPDSLLEFNGPTS